MSHHVPIQMNMANQDRHRQTDTDTMTAVTPESDVNVAACRNILKTNDVRTGLKKPEEEEARLASAAAAAHDDSATAAASAAGRHASSHADAAPPGARDPEWDTANAARQR